MAYTKLSNNLSECIVKTAENFFLTEVFFEGSENVFAVVRKFNVVSELNFFGETKSNGFCYEISSLGDLQTVPAKQLLFKRVVLSHKASSTRFRVSDMLEGFEHN